jgi:hypothetical protein
MPFATLPSSPGFSPPQAPDWTRFAAQANEMIAHRPMFNTADAIDKAVDQISKILELSSPQAKMERQVHMQQLNSLQQLYYDYQQHPDQYQRTAHGPVHIDPVTRIGRIAQINHTIASTNYLNKQITGGGTPDFIKEKMAKLKQAMNAESQGVSIPSAENPQSNFVPVTPTTDTSDTQDNTAATSDALSSGMSEPYDQNE